MVAAQEDLGHTPTSELCWARVLGFLKQAIVTEGLGLGGFRIPDDTRKQSTDTFDDRRGPDFSPEEYEIPERYLLVDEVVDYTLIDAFVAAADQCDLIHIRHAIEMGLGEVLACR